MKQNPKENTLLEDLESARAIGGILYFLLAFLVILVVGGTLFLGYRWGRNSAFNDVQREQEQLLKLKNKKFMGLDAVPLKVDTL